MTGSSSIHEQVMLQSNSMQLEYRVLPLIYSDLEELETYLNAMGRKRWELCGINGRDFIFKRIVKNEKETQGPIKTEEKS